MSSQSVFGRRRFLAILAAAAGLPLLPGRPGAVPQWTWDGIALGAAARIQLCHPDRDHARDVVERCVADLHRLESAFSLYRPDSELSQLNRDGFIDNPSHDFVALMRQSQEWGNLTDGAFDPTVQSLWRLYADHFSGSDPDPRGPSADAIAAAASLVDYRAVDIARTRVAFTKPGMAVTLNGIAQGYITDRIVRRLRDSGIESTLVNMGEIAGVGLSGDGSPWQIGLRGTPENPGIRIPLLNRAVATSAGSATPFEPRRRFHHLFAPHSGTCANHWDALSVIAGSATAADALSTALYVVPPECARQMLQNLGLGADVVAFEAGGRIVNLTGSPTSPSSRNRKPEEGVSS